MRIFAVAAFVVCLGSSSLLADFSYDQSSKVTGGALASMMKIVGAFSKKAREPIRSTVLVKGNRMATVSASNTQIVDLDSETITDVNPEKKTYSVITFAQMTQALQQMARKMEGETKANMNFKASVKDTGESKNISGLDTRRVILTIEMEGTDKESGQTGAMTVTSDMWLAAAVPGYDEVKEFQKRMAQKLAWTPGSTMPMMQPGMAKGMAELWKESSKLEGMPVLMVVTMGAKGQGGEMPEGSAQSARQQQAPPPPSAGEAAEGAAAGAIGSRLGRLGGLGGFGGFGRRKKQQQKEQAAAPPPQETSAESQSAGSGASAGALLEMTTELGSFSSAVVDGSRLEVPSGFKQVESEMLKHLK